MNTHTTGHIGWSPDYKTPRVNRIYGYDPSWDGMIPSNKAREIEIELIEAERTIEKMQAMIDTLAEALRDATFTLSLCSIIDKSGQAAECVKKCDKALAAVEDEKP